MWVWAAGAVAIVCIVGLLLWFLRHESVACKQCGGRFWFDRRLFKWNDASKRIVGFRFDGENKAYPSVIYSEAILSTKCPTCTKSLTCKRNMWMPESNAVELKESIMAQKCKQCAGLGYLEVQTPSEMYLFLRRPYVKCVACSGMGVFKIKDN